ncbi:MAG: Uma2 family endonuclease [Capsulimonadales bacterium]|nr:Uma2 family endonuclease [Capsulimonadales bacterium]
MQDWARLVAEADRVGFRLEMVLEVPTWEASPVFRHQAAVDRIRTSIRNVNYADVQIRFPDGTRKRPDISIFCREPEEQDTEITLIPEAVIEVLSKDYEAKHLLIGIPYYRQIGLGDVVVLDPITGDVKHYPRGRGEIARHSPTTILLACGWECTV